MRAGTQIEVPLDRLVSIVCERVGENGLDFYCPKKDFVIEEIPAAVTPPEAQGIK